MHTMTNTTDNTPKPADTIMPNTNHQPLSKLAIEDLLNRRRYISVQSRESRIRDWDRLQEYQYRKGFYHGISEANRLIYEMKQGGYLRPTEIANMLSNFCTALRKWKKGVWTEDPLKNQETPDLDWETWAEMKRQCHERDGWACTECGSLERLEAHHIESVRYGGVPELSNLTTLCKSCHQSL